MGLSLLKKKEMESNSLVKIETNSLIIKTLQRFYSLNHSTSKVTHISNLDYGPLRKINQKSLISDPDA